MQNIICLSMATEIYKGLLITLCITLYNSCIGSHKTILNENHPHLIINRFVNGVCLCVLVGKSVGISDNPLNPFETLWGLVILIAHVRRFCKRKLGVRPSLTLRKPLISLEIPLSFLYWETTKPRYFGSVSPWSIRVLKTICIPCRNLL